MRKSPAPQAMLITSTLTPMADEAQLEEAVNLASEFCRSLAQRLQSVSAQTEQLASYRPETKRLAIFRRAATMQPIGPVWRLGTILLTPGGDLWAAGKATRAAERGRPGYQSNSREERRDLAASALKGGYAEGTAVNFDAHPLPLSANEVRALGTDEPIGWHDGALRVRWRANAPLEGAATLEQYLEERAALLAPIL